MTSLTIVLEQRQRFAEWHAANLADGAGGPTNPEDSKLKLSTVASFFGDAHSLVVVSGPHPTPAQDRDADRAVAYGLALAHGRRLIAVLPADVSNPTLTRAPWIKNLEVRTYDLEAVLEKSDYTLLGPCPSRAPEEVLDLYRTAPYADAQHLSDDHLGRYLKMDRAGWVDRLTQWAEEDPDLHAAHRQSYLAWQCRGRMVLKIANAKGGLRVTAGVHHGDAANRPEPHHISGLIAPATAHRLIAAASLAAADRLDFIDKGHQEHRLQAALMDGLHELGISRPKREYPAFRPTKDPKKPARAYIDFLGGDDTGRMHIVETKIGNDVMLVLQGLDYWIWATARAANLQANFGLTERPKVVIDFVAAAPASGDAIGPYSLEQANRLADVVEHHFWEVTGWETDRPRITPYHAQQA